MSKLHKKLLVAELCEMEETVKTVKDLIRAAEDKAKAAKEEKESDGSAAGSNPVADKKAPPAPSVTTKDLVPDDFLQRVDAAFASQRSFADYAGFWNNYIKIAKLMQENGKPFGRDFFKKSANGSQNVLDVARGKAALDKVFYPELWVGREREMMQLLFDLTTTERNALDPDKIRLNIARIKGIAFRDEILNKHIQGGYLTVRDAIFTGYQGVIAYKEACAKAGLSPHKDDFLTPDDVGDFCFFQPIHFQHFKDVALMLQAANSPFLVEDLTLSFGGRDSILGRAAANRTLNYIFDPDIWVGRLDEMMTLWENVHINDRNQVNIARVASEIEQRSIAFDLVVDENLTKQDLFKPLHVKGGKTMMLMATKGAWEQFEKIQEILTAKGTPITLNDLRTKVGSGEETLMMKAAQFGCFHHVLGLVRDNGRDHFSQSDLLDFAPSNMNLLGYIEDSDQLSDLFMAHIWQDRPHDMWHVWQAVSTQDLRDECADFEWNHAIVCREALRRRTDKGKRMQRGIKLKP